MTSSIKMLVQPLLCQPFRNHLRRTPRSSAWKASCIVQKHRIQDSAALQLEVLLYPFPRRVVCEVMIYPKHAEASQVSPPKSHGRIHHYRRDLQDWTAESPKSVSVVPTGKNVPFNRRVPLEFAKGYCCVLPQPFVGSYNNSAGTSILNCL